MIQKIEEIKKIREMNYEFVSLVASYLNNCPNAIDKDLVEGITCEITENEERVYRGLLANIFFEDEDLARVYEREYLSYGVKRLDPQEYLNNPYYKSISIPKSKVGGWELGYQKYEPYECFIYRDIVKKGYTEIPQIGFFNVEFQFPTVFENGVEWMAIKPNEIETMKAPIENAQGSVLIYGLGIGYFAYMVSQKEQVSSIVIVERDENVINLFNDIILPQFPNKNKITVIKSDAFEYAEKHMRNNNFDYVFTDLWHDVSDGVDLYIKMKKHEGVCPKAKFDYWIEGSILSSIRWSIFDGIYTQVKENPSKWTLNEIETYLSDKYLKEFVKFI